MQAWIHPSYERPKGASSGACRPSAGTRRYQTNKGEAESRAVSSSTRLALTYGRGKPIVF